MKVYSNKQILSLNISISIINVEKYLIFSIVSDENELLYRWPLRQYMLPFKLLFTCCFYTRWSGSSGRQTSSSISTTSYSCASLTFQCMGWWLLPSLLALKLLLLLCHFSSTSGTCSLVSSYPGQYVISKPHLFSVFMLRMSSLSNFNSPCKTWFQ